MALHLKYRPENFDEVVGNGAVVKSLKSLLKKPDRPHTYLFTGIRGGGKTTLARIMANQVGAHADDITELDIGDFNGVDTIRQLRREATLAPSSGKARAWILDEVHNLSGPGQTALLKIAEDTPRHVYFFLCTNLPGKIVAALKSRCTTYEVETMAPSAMKDLLEWVLDEEGVKGFSPEAIKLICKKSMGSPREALVLLESVMGLDGNDLLDYLESFQNKEHSAIELAQALLAKRPWKDVAKLLKAIVEKEDPEGMRQMVLAYTSTILLNGNNPQAAIMMDAFIEPNFYNGKAGLIHSCYNALA